MNERFIHRGDIYEIMDTDEHENRFSEQYFTFYKYRDKYGRVTWIDSIYTQPYLW